VRGQIVDVWQDLTDNESGATQKFDHRERSGDTGWAFFCNTFITCPQSIINGGTVNMTNGDSVIWAAGDAVTGTWIGSEIGGVFGLTEVSSPGNGKARYVGSDTTANGWPEAVDADLNWPLDPNVSDPFTDPTSPLSLPGSPRTLPPS